MSKIYDVCIFNGITWESVTFNYGKITSHKKAEKILSAFQSASPESEFKIFATCRV